MVAVGEGTFDFIVKFFFFIRKRVVIGHIFRGPRGILRHTTTGRVRSGDSSLQALYFTNTDRSQPITHLERLALYRLNYVYEKAFELPSKPPPLHLQ